MKKIFCLLICIVLFVNMVVFAEDEAVATVEEQIATTQEELRMLTYEEQSIFDVLVFLGVFNGHEDLDDTVTKAEMAHYIFELSGYEILPEYTEGYYYDVPASHPYFKEINFLSEQGVISGYQGAFNPDALISLNEAAKLLVLTAGYGNMASFKGGYPAGYLYAVNNLKLFDNINKSVENITKGDAMTLFKNLLECEVNGEISTLGIDGYYMSAIFDMYKLKDILWDTGITSIYPEKPSQEGVIAIGDETFECSDDLSEYLGMFVSAYYVDSNDGNILVSVRPDKDTSVLILRDYDITEYSNFSYSYSTEGSSRERQVKIKSDFDVIYNGRFVSENEAALFDDSMMIPENGEVRLIDTDDNSEIDVVVIWNYKPFVVRSYVDEEETFYSVDGKDTINFGDAEAYSYIGLSENGEIVTLETAGIYGTVLSYAMSLDGQSVKIYLCSKILTDRINILNSTEKTVKIGDNTYHATRGFFNLLPELGDAKVFLNQYGEAFYFERNFKIDDNYACLVKIAMDDAPFSDSLRIFLYTASNQLIDTTIASDAIIDGEKISSATGQANALTGMEKTIVKYKLNGKNQVRFLDTQYFNSAKEDADDSINRMCESTTSSLSRDNLSIGDYNGIYLPKAPISPNSYIMVTTADFDTKQMYCYPYAQYLEKFSPYTSSNIGKGTLYNSSRSRIDGEFMLIVAASIGETALNLNYDDIRGGGIVTEISKVLVEGDELYSLHVERGVLSTDIYLQPDAMFVSENGKNIPTEENNIEIDIGDIIKWGTDYKGIVTADNICLIYDHDRDYFAYSAASLEFTAVYEHLGTWHDIWVYDKKADWIVTFSKDVLAPIDAVMANPLEENFGYIDYTLGTTGAKPEVYVFERNRDVLYKGDMSYLDLSYKYHRDMGETHEYSAENASRAIAFYMGGHRFFIVYR